MSKPIYEMLEQVNFFFQSQVLDRLRTNVTPYRCPIINIVSPKDSVYASIEAQYGDPYCVDTDGRVGSIEKYICSQRNKSKGATKEVGYWDKWVCGIH